MDEEEFGFEEVMEGESGAEGGPAPDQPGVEEGGLQSALKAQIDDAIDYSESDLAHDRLEAASMYRGDGLETDESLDATRSKAVSRDVHDTVHAMLPSIIRVFFSGKDVVEFDPQGPEDEGWAQQATDYVNQIVLQKDNEGFIVFYSAIKDCLIKGIGVFKWWWDEDYHVEAHRYSGLDQATFQVLAGDPSVSEIYDHEQDAFGMMSCTVARKVSKGGYARVEAVPPEERLIDRSARSIDDSKFYGHRRTVTVSDLVAMGFDFTQVSRLTGSDNMDTNEEKVERYDNQVYQDNVITSDPSQRTLEFIEAYMRIDLDADGVAELYKVSCGGTGYEILVYADDGEQAVELVDEIPFAEICPDPEPHLATGNSVSDQVIDLQKIKTGLLRGTLDSLSRAIFPREEVVEQQVNMNDVLNPEIGATIRTKNPGMIREIVTPFMGKECLPVMEYMDGIKADRTGISDTTQGLNPEAMQSTTAVGVQAAVSASQQQLELVARIIAQTGVTRLFRGLLTLIKSNQDQTRTVKLRNNWVPIDPRACNGNMDAIVNTALGRGSDTDKMGMLNMVASKQELAMTTLGPNNQLATMVEYRNTLAEMVTLAGYYNPDKFFLPVEHGQVMEQMNQQLQEAQAAQKEAEDMSRNLEYELRNHRASEDANKDADSIKKGTEALKNVVDAIQTADQVVVGDDPAADEAAAAGKYVQ